MKDEASARDDRDDRDSLEFADSRMSPWKKKKRKEKQEKEKKKRNHTRGRHIRTQAQYENSIAFISSEVYLISPVVASRDKLQASNVACFDVCFC